MRKVFLLLGSLLTFIGLKAQSDSLAKKETQPAPAKQNVQLQEKTENIKLAKEGNATLKAPNSKPLKEHKHFKTESPKPLKLGNTAKPLKY